MSQQTEKDKQHWFEDNTHTTCPRCAQEDKKKETVASTIEEIDVLFGWRWTPAPKKSPLNQQLIPQSHCRECRLEQSRDRRRKAREAAKKEELEAARRAKNTETA